MSGDLEFFGRPLASSITVDPALVQVAEISSWPDPLNPANPLDLLDLIDLGLALRQAGYRRIVRRLDHQVDHQWIAAWVTTSGRRRTVTYHRFRTHAEAVERAHRVLLADT